MAIVLPNLFTASEAEQLRQQAESLPLVDGRTTAGSQARAVKHNQQVSEAAATELLTAVGRKVFANPIFQSTTWPREIHSLRINRYGSDMSYGRHIDNALMNGHRCDFSMTLFLSDPDSYAGGELIVEDSLGNLGQNQTFKLPAGSLLIYPSGNFHEVQRVTSGERWAIVGWVQSRIRLHEHRQVLSEIQTVRQSLTEQSQLTDEAHLLSKSLNGLIRLWAE